MQALATALRAGRVVSPFTRSALAGMVSDDQVDAVRQTLVDLAVGGMSPSHVAVLLDVLAEERAAQQQQTDRLDLVLSPPEFDCVDARDTSVVVRDLFQRAARSVLVATFALDTGERARALFGGLAARMDATPELRVTLYVNIHRRHQDDTPAAALVAEFAGRFAHDVWPGKRLPEVLYDPRSVDPEGNKRAVLHAKCVVVDDRWTFLTSANFTEAAQERNIEAGVVVDDPRIAERVGRQFERLAEAGALRRLSLKR